MKINDKYEVRVMVAELTSNGYGNIYDSLDDFRAAHPGSKPMYGYVVVNSETGKIPPECGDFFESVDEAIRDYNENCAPHYCPFCNELVEKNEGYVEYSGDCWHVDCFEGRAAAIMYETGQATHHEEVYEHWTAFPEFLP